MPRHRAARARWTFPATLLLGAVWLAGCDRPPAAAVLSATEVEIDLETALVPREAYAASIRMRSDSDPAAIQGWISEGARAADQAAEITLPYVEEGRLSPEAPRAVGYRFRLRTGERVFVRVEGEELSGSRLFIDLVGERPPRRGRGSRPEVEGGLETLASPLPVVRTLVHDAAWDGEYTLRLQPEAGAGGAYRISISRLPSLTFPVLGRTSSAILSFFGAARDGGAREHHGVDIFAPRGTPVLASTDGRVRRANDTEIGGKVVWITDGRGGQNLYYAHLDSQTVSRGDEVRTGDTIGFVGNTGNARTTPPHLHFGVYRRPGGPVDPAPFIRESLSALSFPGVASGGLPSEVRAGAPDGARLYAGPSSRVRVRTTLGPRDRARVVGTTNRYLRVLLGDGSEGFVRTDEVVAVSARTDDAS